MGQMGGNSIAGNTSAFSAGGYIGPTTSLGAAGGSDLIPAPMGTGQAIGSTSYTYGGTSWEEFCERHARAAASDFAKACINYINGNLPPEEARNIPHRSFALKFVECFSDHYDTEFFRRRSNLKTGIGSLFENSGGSGADFDNEHEHEVSRLFPKSLLRRLSFKGLRKGKVSGCRRLSNSWFNIRSYFSCRLSFTRTLMMLTAWVAANPVVKQSWPKLLSSAARRELLII